MGKVRGALPAGDCGPMPGGIIGRRGWFQSDKAPVVREEQRNRARLKIHDVPGVWPVHLAALDAKFVRPDGVKKCLRFTAARERRVNPALEGEQGRSVQH